ncbi:MAG: TlpA family protein disulfide reductase [Anaerolineales bacterium]|nr:TlpA family protein disulfide reductase [Anaerolineales bacterium]
MQNKTTLTIILITILACTLAMICLACGAAASLVDWDEPISALPQDLEVGNLAPDFELFDINGQPHRLSDYRGQPVLLNFWALWCGPCKAEMPLLQQRYSELYPELVILAIEDDSELYNLRRYVNEEALTFHFLIGNRDVQQLYHIYAFPTSYFIDSQGIIQAVQLGSLSANELNAALQQIGLEE